MLLGSYCNQCSSEQDLEFDCIIPQGDAHHKYDTSHRMCFYFKQYRNNNLQLLCSKCHSKKTQIEQETIPF